jgi:uncharacterized protein
MQYVLHAYDHTDAEAPERRQKVRPDHLETARRLKENGHFVLGGALLSPSGQMIGSLLVVDFEKEDDLEQWLASDPYVTGKVWDKIDVKPFRQAQV